MKGKLSLLLQAMKAAVSGCTPLLADRLRRAGLQVSEDLPLQPGAKNGLGKSRFKSAPTAGRQCGCTATAGRHSVCVCVFDQRAWQSRRWQRAAASWTLQAGLLMLTGQTLSYSLFDV